MLTYTPENKHEGLYKYLIKVDNGIDIKINTTRKIEYINYDSEIYKNVVKEILYYYNEITIENCTKFLDELLQLHGNFSYMEKIIVKMIKNKDIMNIGLSKLEFVRIFPCVDTYNNYLYSYIDGLKTENNNIINIIIKLIVCEIHIICLY